MENDHRDSMREMLLDSYKPRESANVACVICGQKGKPLSFHAIRYYQDERDALPERFVPLSASRGTIRGCFPVCTACARPCRKCGLPILSEKLEEYFVAAKCKFKASINIGSGVCEHMHMSLLVQALFKRLFRIGRFSKRRHG